MSKTNVRLDKTCLNCRQVVEKRYCSNCGQENIDVRKNFYHLFVHFFEDLTHYENAFWRTIKNLVIKPGALTNEYLSGKRMSYLAPIRLYIFISFVTFLSISLLSLGDEEIVTIDTKLQKENTETLKQDTRNYTDSILKELSQQKHISAKDADSLKQLLTRISEQEPNDNKLGFFSTGSKTVAEYEAKIKKMSESERPNALEQILEKKSIELNNKYTMNELKEHFLDSFVKNIPKVLFVYMPIFALVLWIFENKRKYLYFDHGIFTLHYFSFLLLFFLALHIFDWILTVSGLNQFKLVEIVDTVISVLAYVYVFYYFFPAHHRFYKNSRVVSFFKGISIFFINIIAFLITLTATVLLTFYHL